MDDYREEGWGKETQWEDILLSEGKPNIDEDEILEKVKRGLRMQTLSWSHQKSWLTFMIFLLLCELKWKFGVALIL